MGFDETVQYLYDLQKFGTKLGLENTHALLELLGRPDRGMKYLHVAGTNGKGSVSALSASALSASGIRAGLYTSPHLVSFTERMKVDGRPVTEEEIVALADRLRALIAEKAKGLKPTFFEFTTAMAFDYFEREGVEAAVMEVGMGGRLDSTNVIVPECSVITNVDMEHMEYLGDTMEKIAYEKAGVIKPGVPCVTAEKKPAVLDVIEGACRDNGSSMYLLGRDFGFKPAGRRWEGGRVVQEMDYSGPGGDIKGLEIPLAGAHQMENAAVAACALGVMSERGVPAGEEAIRAGFADVKWEGRLEVVSHDPLLVLDGAHNPASVTRLAEALQEYFVGRFGRLIMVVGVLSDKDARFMLETLAPLADVMAITQAEYERAVPAEELLTAAGAARSVVVRRPVSDALSWALSEAEQKDMVLVTGSLYVVGEAKAWLESRRPFIKA